MVVEQQRGRVKLAQLRPRQSHGATSGLCSHFTCYNTAALLLASSGGGGGWRVAAAGGGLMRRGAVWEANLCFAPSYSSMPISVSLHESHRHLFLCTPNLHRLLPQLQLPIDRSRPPSQQLPRHHLCYAYPRPRECQHSPENTCLPLLSEYIPSGLPLCSMYHPLTTTIRRARRSSRLASPAAVPNANLSLPAHTVSSNPSRIHTPSANLKNPPTPAASPQIFSSPRASRHHAAPRAPASDGPARPVLPAPTAICQAPSCPRTPRLWGWNGSQTSSAGSFSGGRGSLLR